MQCHTYISILKCVVAIYCKRNNIWNHLIRVFTIFCKFAKLNGHEYLWVTNIIHICIHWHQTNILNSLLHPTFTHLIGAQFKLFSEQLKCIKRIINSLAPHKAREAIRLISLLIKLMWELMRCVELMSCIWHILWGKRHVFRCWS